MVQRFATNRLGNERKVLRPIQVFVMTKAFHDAFVQQRSISELHDYATVRKVMSLENLAEQHAVEGLLSSKLDVYLDSLIYSYTETLTPEQVMERKAVIQPLGSSDRIQRIMEQYLHDVVEDEDQLVACSAITGSAESDAVTPPYQLQTFQNKIYILVEEGFLKVLEDKTSKQAFFTDVVKTMYSLDRINNVNCSSWYRHYLTALCANSSL